MHVCFFVVCILDGYWLQKKIHTGGKTFFLLPQNYSHDVRIIFLDVRIYFHVERINFHAMRIVLFPMRSSFASYNSFFYSKDWQRIS